MVSGSAPSRRVITKRKVFSFVLLIVILLVVAGLVDSNFLIVATEYELSYANLPAAFDGFRIAVLSDVHAAVFGEGNERLISLVRDAAPDIIAITGDLIDGHAGPAAAEQLGIAAALVEALVTIAPVYYITGNHDWDSGSLWRLLPMLEDRGVCVLRNSYVLLEAGGDSIVLAGTDDPNGPADMVRPAAFVEGVLGEGGAGGDKFFVMLEHRNGNLPLYGAYGVDLVLCGHAHGGIIRLPFTDGLIGPQREWFPTFTSGVYSVGGSRMVVSRGVGNHTGWPRFLNNPEVVVVELVASH